jgi:hypothetical protein
MTPFGRNPGYHLQNPALLNLSRIAGCERRGRLGRRKGRERERQVVYFKTPMMDVEFLRGASYSQF